MHMLYILLYTSVCVYICNVCTYVVRPCFMLLDYVYVMTACGMMYMYIQLLIIIIINNNNN